MTTAEPPVRGRRLRVALPAALLTAGLTAGLSGGLVAGLPVVATAAQPPLPAVTVSEEAVAAARAQVQAVSARVAAVAVRLADGTERWKAGRAELERARAAAQAAQDAADEARGRAEARRRTLAGFVNANYRSPSTSPLLLHVGSPSGIADTLRASADLDRIREEQRVALDAADAAGEEADAAQAVARGLSDDAAAQERRLAADLAALEALADRTSADLDAAAATADRLEAQRAEELARREAARIAAEKAAAEEAAREAARQAAERAAALGRKTPKVVVAPPVRAPRMPVASGCAGRSTGGYANGTIPASALCPLSYAPGHMLRADAAAAFNALTDAARSARGVPLCVTDSYRSYAVQVRLYKEKPDLAAIPGTSNHGWGVAVDLCGGVQDFGTAAHQWLKANGARYGWVHPGWAEPGGSRPEPWHWEYVG